MIGLFGGGDYEADRVDLVGVEEGGVWAALARALAGNRVAHLAIDSANFRFADLQDLRDPMFLPGAAKYHDLPGILAAAAPAPLWLADAGDSLPQPITAAYKAAGAAEAVRRYTGDAAGKWTAAAHWLLKH